MLPYLPYLGSVVALVAGILILIQPGLLSLICGDLPDCNRHTWSGGGKAHRPMVVERMILKRSSLLVSLKSGRVTCFCFHCIFFSLNGVGALLAGLERGRGNRLCLLGCKTGGRI
jgi:hypothetical protein